MTNQDMQKAAQDDLKHLIHPQYFAPDHQDPIIFERGEGSWLFDYNGNKYLDGLSSLWNVAVGHGRKELAEAAQEQISKVAFTNNYTGFSNLPAIQLAKKIIDLTYDNMQGVFFTNSGSESNEGSFKTARFYWNLQGKSGKNKLIARHRAYHGGTLATSAMTGLPPFWKYFGPLPPEIIHAEGESKDDELLNSDGETANWIEETILREGPETVAAVIAEPVKGAGGVWTPSEEYFKRLREICDKYEVLLIADEVITGFGRTGHWFALERWGVQPDIVSFAKAVTSGYIPMGGFIVSKEIMDALQNVPADAKFMHAYTNSAHPTASAVGLRNLQIIEDEQLVNNAQAMGQYLTDGLHNIFDGKQNITNIRTLGFIAGFSLVQDADTNTAFDPSLGIGAKFAKHLREECGVITRFVGDQIVLAPPLITNKEEIDFLIDGLDQSLQSIK